MTLVLSRDDVSRLLTLDDAVEVLAPTFMVLAKVEK